MRVLSDDLVLEVLGLLPAHVLAAMSLVSKSLYCFSAHEDLWKALVLQVWNPESNNNNQAAGSDY